MPAAFTAVQNEFRSRRRCSSTSAWGLVGRVGEQRRHARQTCPRAPSPVTARRVHWMAGVPWPAARGVHASYRFSSVR
jgi:hypothetical protein